MSNIYVNSSGNGYAYVDNSSPVQGDNVTLYCVPDPGETLDDVTATDYQGYSIALATTPVQSFIYQDAWQDMTIYVTFSGGTPPPPPPDPPWKWAILFKKKRRFL